MTLDEGFCKLGVIKFFFILFLFILKHVVIIGEDFSMLQMLKFSSILKHIVVISKGFSKLYTIEIFSILKYALTNGERSFKLMCFFKGSYFFIWYTSHE